ncbi:MAG: DUF5663 domain-containing protein [Candidatus Paceibacterota bacterium]|jgi:hypothetical protein
MTKNATLTADEMTDQFIDQLIIEAGMDKGLEGDVLVQLKKDLRERLENRVNATMLSQMPEDKLDEFQKLLESKDGKATQDFCNENIPNLAELVAAEFVSFRDRYLTL